MSDSIYTRSLALLGPDAAPVVHLYAALQYLLPLFNDHSDMQVLRRRCGIAPWRIVSLPWHPRRLADARRQRAAGRKPPPVHVTRFLIQRQVWYLVTDGMHRAWAAREAGVSRVGAYIDSEVRCHPEACYLRRTGEIWQLWHRLTVEESARRASSGTVHAEYVGEVPSALLPMVRVLGASTEPDTA